MNNGITMTKPKKRVNTRAAAKQKSNRAAEEKSSDEDQQNEAQEEVSTSADNSTTNTNSSPANPLALKVSEKIILILDTACDDIYTNFKWQKDTLVKPVDMLKRALHFFLQNKNAINPKHEYALVLLKENIAVWKVGFTDNIDNILDSLDGIEECEAEDVFDLNSVFDLIVSNVKLPEVEPTSTSPPYVIHALLLYNRSFTIPEMDKTPLIEQYMQSPYFLTDILITHEVPESSNHCKKIIEKLQKAANIGKGEYFFPVARDAKLLHESIARFMCHPLQRPHQHKI